MTWLYRFIYKLVVYGLLPWLSPVSRKLHEGYLLRQKQDQTWPWLLSPRGLRPVWIHCASGEFEYALPLIREIKKQSPTQKILVTYFTPSYAQKMKAEPLVDFVAPSPWDEPHVLKEFLNHHQPVALLFARTDIWFEMAHQCRRLGIPVMVFSMTFAKSIFPLWRFFYRWRLQSVDDFFVVSPEDERLLKEALPQARITVCGDTRYDQCLYRLAMNRKLPVDVLSSAKKCVVAGSTWPEDEAILLPVLQQTWNLWRWVIVPHEATATHLTSLETQMAQLKIPVQRLSRLTQWNGNGVLLVDVMGCLAEFYKIADASFVGGSFRRRVHSVMEALACGSLTLVGPFYKNNREAVEFLQQNSEPVRVVANSEELLSTLKKGLSEWTPELRQSLQNQVQSRSGVSLKVLQKINLQALREKDTPRAFTTSGVL